MSNLKYKIIAYLGKKPDFNLEVIMQNDGQGAYISFWSDSLEKTKPTDAQLNALETEATKLKNNANADGSRMKQYGSWQEQFEMIYKDQKNGTTTYKDHCDKVRSDNPKE
tara:strand:+ start:210 stop:539 length:330 start_codon:yes stop_codon:yes gene_type:complete